MKGKKLRGISPLVAVIMLIAFTLIVAGILAGWATQFAQTQRRTVETCIDARVLLQRGNYDRNSQNLTLVVYNYGRVPLELFTLLTYKDMKLHPTGTESFPERLNVSAGSIAAFIIPEVTPDLSEVMIQSEQCPGVQDILRDIDITGL